MLGKNAARAAPMLAFAARRACSALRMSGRCVSRSEGRPSGTCASSPSVLDVLGGRKIRRNLLPEHERECVDVQRELALVLREARACGLDRALGLAQAQKRRGVALVHRLGELVGLGLALERLLRELHQCLVGEHREIVGCHLGNEADLRAAPGLALREILLEGFRREAALATEQIELVIGEADSGGVVVEGGGCAARWAPRCCCRPSRRRPRAAAAPFAGSLLGKPRAGGGNGREEVAALYPELCLRGRDVQHGDAQIAVVLERDLDEALKARIGEEIPPADLIGRATPGAGSSRASWRRRRASAGQRSGTGDCGRW